MQRAVFAGAALMGCILGASVCQQLVDGSSLEKVHFEAWVSLDPVNGPLTAKTAQAPVESMVPLGERNASGDIGSEAIYQVFFHGPAYRVLSTVARSPTGSLLA